MAALAAALLACLLVSCNGAVSTSGDGAAPTLRVANLAYGAPYNFDVLEGSTSAATDLAYGQASTFRTINAGTLAVAFDPTGTTTAAMTANVAATTGNSYSVLALENSSALTYLTVAQPVTTIASGQTQVSFVNATTTLGALDIYVSAPTAALPSSPSVVDLAYAGAGASVTPTPVVLTGGDFRIRAVANGDATRTVIFDSGTVTFDAGATPLLVITPATGSASSIAIASLAADSTVTSIGDQRVQVRVGNFAPGGATLDAYFDQNGAANTAVFQAGIALGTAGAYQTFAPGAYHASFTDTGSTTELLGSDLSLAPGTSVSVFAVGIGSTAPYDYELLAVSDDLSAPATGMAKLRILQLAPDVTGGITSCGVNCVDLVTLTTVAGVVTIGQRLLVNQPYAATSPLYVTLAPGTYTLAAVASGAATPLLPSSTGLTVTLTANTVNTLVLAGCQTPGSGICSGGTTTPVALQLIPLGD